MPVPTFTTNVIVPERYLVRVRCVDDSCARHNAPHLDNPGHVMSYPCFTLGEARRVAADWERGTTEFASTIYDPQGQPVGA